MDALGFLMMAIVSYKKFSYISKSLSTSLKNIWHLSGLFRSFHLEHLFSTMNICWKIQTSNGRRMYGLQVKEKSLLHSSFCQGKHLCCSISKAAGEVESAATYKQLLRSGRECMIQLSLGKTVEQENKCNHIHRKALSLNAMTAKMVILDLSPFSDVDGEAFWKAIVVAVQWQQMPHALTL